MTSGKKSRKEEPTPIQVFPGSKMEQLQALYNQWYACKKCNLHMERLNPTSGEPLDDITFGDGNASADILIVGEAPGEEEEATSLPFVGPSGRLFNQLLANVSADPSIQQLSKDYSKSAKRVLSDDDFHKYVMDWRREEFFITNVVACRPPDNRAPNNLEIKACWERLWNIVYIVDPLVIIAVGKVAMTTLLGRTVEITRIRGQLHDVEYEGRLGKLKYPIVPILHPSYLLRKADWKDKNGDYVKTVEDLMKAMKVVDVARNKHFGTPIPKRVELQK